MVFLEEESPQWREFPVQFLSRNTNMNLRRCVQVTHHDTFDMKLLDINQFIPLLYWTSKQHKCPHKFCFLFAGASKCYNKQIAIELSLTPKCIKHHFKNYCKVIEKRTGFLECR